MELGPLWFDQYGNKDELDIMRQWIIDNEQKIIEENKQKSKDDGGTGLGLDSLTVQYNSFNLFKVTKKSNAFTNLFAWLQQSYNNFMNEHKTQPKKMRDVLLGPNVVRKGQSS